VVGVDRDRAARLDIARGDGSLDYERILRAQAHLARDFHEVVPVGIGYQVLGNAGQRIDHAVYDVAQQRLQRVEQQIAPLPTDRVVGDDDRGRLLAARVAGDRAVLG